MNKSRIGVKACPAFICLVLDSSNHQKKYWGNMLVDTPLWHPDCSEGILCIYKCVYRFSVIPFFKMTRCVNWYIVFLT